MNLPWVIEVRLAGLVDELRDLAHALVHGQPAELPGDHQPEDEAEHAHAEPQAEEGATVHPPHAHLREVGNPEIRLAAALVGLGEGHGGQGEA